MNSNYKELKYYGRYRDDCFVLWSGTLEKLNQFFEYLNSLDDDLKFTMEVGNKELCFLDVKISIVNNTLETTIYSKPTDSHLYLHATSCHNNASIKGIPKGVALRVRRLCSTDIEYEQKAIDYMEYLKLRGYNDKGVKTSFEKYAAKSRAESRLKVHKQGPSSRPIIFSTKFNPRGPNVQEIINSFLPILQDAPSIKDLFPDGSIMVANKKESNLKSLLLRSNPYVVKEDLLQSDD